MTEFEIKVFEAMKKSKNDNALYLNLSEVLKSYEAETKHE